MFASNTKQIDKKIRTLFKKGIDKPEIYSKLSKKYPDDIDTVYRLLKQYPDLQTQKKYRVWVNMLLILLIIVTVLKIINAFIIFINISPLAMPVVFFVPLINIWMIVEISRYKQMYFLITGFLTIAGIQGINSVESGFFFAVFAIPIIIISFFISYKFRKNIKLNHDKIISHIA